MQIFIIYSRSRSFCCLLSDYTSSRKECVVYFKLSFFLHTICDRNWTELTFGSFHVRPVLGSKVSLACSGVCKLVGSLFFLFRFRRCWLFRAILLHRFIPSKAVVDVEILQTFQQVYVFLFERGTHVQELTLQIAVVSAIFSVRLACFNLTSLFANTLTQTQDYLDLRRSQFYRRKYFLIHYLLILFLLQWFDPWFVIDHKIRSKTITLRYRSRTQLTNQWNCSPSQFFCRVSAVALNWTKTSNLRLRDIYGHEV